MASTAQRTQFPSIPMPGNTPAQMMATVTALVQAVQLLIVNAGPTTSQPLTSNAQAFATGNSAQALSDVVAKNAANIAGGVGLEGTVSKGSFILSGAAALNSSNVFPLQIPGAMLEDGTVTAEKLQGSGLTLVAGAASGASGTSAECDITLATASNVFIFYMYAGGSAVSPPSGNGEFTLTVNGTPENVMPVINPGGGADIPSQMGFTLVTNAPAGDYTIKLQLLFNSGGTPLPYISLGILALANI